MNKLLLCVASMFSVVCPRCGNRMRRNDRNCTECNAFNAEKAITGRGQLLEQDSAPNAFENGQPVHLTASVAPFDVHRRHVSSWSLPTPLMKRTLSVKSAFLGACAVGLIASGLTYLRFGTSNVEVEPSDEMRSSARPGFNASSDMPSDVTYMTPKALHEIDARLRSANSAPDLLREATPAETDPEQAAPVPDIRPDVRRDSPSGISALNAATSPPSSPAQNAHSTLQADKSSASAVEQELRSRVNGRKRWSEDTYSSLKSAGATVSTGATIAPAAASVSQSLNAASKAPSPSHNAAADATTGAVMRAPTKQPARVASKVNQEEEPIGPAFSDLSDPDAAERTIMLYGWKAKPGAAQPH
jgi:hypothetical protein